MDSQYGRRAFVRDLVSFLYAVPFVTGCTHRVGRARVRRIGFISGAGYDPLLTAFKEELRRLGYIDGADIVIETRLSRPDTSDLSRMAPELDSFH